MSAIYDNWERLVAAVLKKQQLWELFHDYSRSPSILSEASDLNSSFRSRSPFDDLECDFVDLGSSSTYWRTPKLVFISDFSPVIDVKDVCLAPSELLGRGTFGSCYAAAMDNGVRIVMKRLSSMIISETESYRHMTIVGGVKHENVVALRAYYSSEQERLMLYDYNTRGSVLALLHGGNGVPLANVDWETRLKIAIGAARGITEIHKQNGGKLVHGNIRASNVFLNPDQYGSVSDFGLTNMIETTFKPPAYCYAPEVKNTHNVSQASDVYSFGILLLELLTRKPSVHVPGGPKAVDLVKLVTSVRNKSRAAKVFDADLLKLPTIRDQTVKMLQIGMRCIEKSTKKRPKISEVLKMLEDIMVLNPISLAPVARGLVSFDDANTKFDRQDLSRASTEVLGRGTHGTSYKAILEDGNVISVKRLKDVISKFEDFRDHMEVIGRMRHENIARVRAYYFHNDERVLIYDYYNQDSVSALLHGRRRAARTPLDWETRLKIAVGAARGIVHIHKQDGQKLAHGNIKSSNIFLTRQKDGIVSHAGLEELTSHTRASQASDVFGFGVVLLELLSSKPPEFSGHTDFTSLVEWVQSFSERWITEVLYLELLRSEIEEQTMLQVLRIAMDCVGVVPEGRPRMSHVVVRLEEIIGIEALPLPLPIEQRSQVQVSLEEIRGIEALPLPRSIEQRFKDLLEDMLVGIDTRSGKQ